MTGTPDRLCTSLALVYRLLLAIQYYTTFYSIPKISSTVTQTEIYYTYIANRPRRTQKTYLYFLRALLEHAQTRQTEMTRQYTPVRDTASLFLLLNLVLVIREVAFRRA